MRYASMIRTEDDEKPLAARHSRVLGLTAYLWPDGEITVDFYRRRKSITMRRQVGGWWAVCHMIGVMARNRIELFAS